MTTTEIQGERVLIVMPIIGGGPGQRYTTEELVATAVGERLPVTIFRVWSVRPGEPEKLLDTYNTITKAFQAMKKLGGWG